MDYAIIGTWGMSLEGVRIGWEILKNDGSAEEAVVEAIKYVEDQEAFRSVGYSGLPNALGQVELDAGFMDGDRLDIGGVFAVQNVKNPIVLARALSKNKYNNFLSGLGAENYWVELGYRRENLLSSQSFERYLKKKDKLPEGHDTVGVVALDKLGSMVVGTSTSGLFMKKEGRVGDSPIIGSGFYADSQVGAAAATGLGEDIMKGCISYEIVSLLEDGLGPREAANHAVSRLDEKLRRRRGQALDISVVCLDSKGQAGVATNIEEFSFSYASSSKEPKIYRCFLEASETKYTEADQAWIENYYLTEDNLGG